MAVDQSPLLRAFSFQSFSERREHIRAIAAHFSFIDETRESSRAGQYAKEGNFGKRDSGVTVVNQIDFIASNRQFITATGGSAVQRGNVTSTGMARVVFNRTARLVRELAKVDFERV